MSELEIGPKTVDVEGQRYDYQRIFLEILICQTCQAQFWTHITTGHGAFMLQDDKDDYCDGCKEILSQSEITEKDQVRPS